jgi:hypothetical protein
VAYVARLFSGPDDAVEEVSHEFYDRVILIDAGENTTQITCSRCGGEISVEWFFGPVEGNGESFDHLDVTVPCCAALVRTWAGPKPNLPGHSPLRLASRLRPFRGERHEPDRAKYELDAEELATWPLFSATPSRTSSLTTDQRPPSGPT